MQTVLEINPLSEDGQIEAVICPLGSLYIESIFQRLSADLSNQRKLNRDNQRSLHQLFKSFSPFFSISLQINISSDLLSHLDSKTIRILQRLQNRHPRITSGAFPQITDSEDLITQKHLVFQQYITFSGIWKQPFTKIKSNFIFGSLQRYGRTVQMMEAKNILCRYLSTEKFVGIVLEFARPVNCVFAICLPKIRSLSFPKFTDQDYQQLLAAPLTYCNPAIPKFDSYFTWEPSKFSPDLFLEGSVQQSTLFRMSELGLANSINNKDLEKVISFQASRTFDYRVIYLDTNQTIISGIFDGYRE